MTRHKSLCFYAMASTALITAAPSVASSHTSPGPGEAYRGDITLDQAYVAHQRLVSRYDSLTAAVSVRRAQGRMSLILSCNADRFAVAQPCIDGGAGPASRSVERQTVTVLDAPAFTLPTRGSRTTCRYRSANITSEDLKRTAK